MTKSAIEARKLSLEREKMETDKKLKERKLDQEHQHWKDEKAWDRSTQFIPTFKLKNDPKWYKNYLSDLDNFVRIPTFDRLGSELIADYIARSAENGAKLSVPGIMIFEWVPSLGQGKSSGLIDGSAFVINQAMARLKEVILKLNSRSNTDWEMADLALNLYCSSDIMTLILELGRVIRVYKRWHIANSYLAEYLIEALGWSFQDISSKYAEYRKAYQLLCRKFNSAIVVPSAMSFFHRRAYLARGIFIDTDKADYPRQMYAYRQYGYHKLNDAGDATSFHALDTGVRDTIEHFTSTVNELIDQVAMNPGYIEMYQDLRMAFTERVELPEDEIKDPIEFAVDGINKFQIHNLKTLPIFDYKAATKASITGANGFQLIQQDGYIISKQEVAYSMNGIFDADYLKAVASKYLGMAPGDTRFKGANVYNMPGPEVTGDEILDITRNNCILELTEYVQEGGFVTSAKFCVRSSGTEVIIDAYTYRIAYKTDGTRHLSLGLIGTVEVDVPMGGEFRDKVLSTLGHFNWHPIVHYMAQSDYDGILYTFGFMDTTFLINHTDLDKINQACILSEFYIPETFKPRR